MKVANMKRAVDVAAFIEVLSNPQALKTMAAELNKAIETAKTENDRAEKIDNGMREALKLKNDADEAMSKVVKRESDLAVEKSKLSTAVSNMTTAQDELKADQDKLRDDETALADNIRKFGEDRKKLDEDIKQFDIDKKKLADELEAATIEKNKWKQLNEGFKQLGAKAG